MGMIMEVNFNIHHYQTNDNCFVTLQEESETGGSLINLMEDGEDLGGDFGGSNEVMTAEENDSMQGEKQWSGIFSYH